MKLTLTLLLVIFSFAAKLSAQCSTNILLNPSFETPVQTNIGNNLTGLLIFNGWTMTGGAFNVIKTNGSPYNGGPDNAQNGIQYIDITNGAGVTYQDFTISGGPLSVGYSGYFSSREQSAGYVNWTARIDIIDIATSTVVSSSNTRAFTNADGADPAQETWYYLLGNVILPSGNYRYSANFGDFGNFDNAFLATNCVLAVQIAAFNGNYDNGKIILNWRAENENNFSHFEIERSNDGINFTNIGTASLSATHDYIFTDNAPLSEGKNFYRLKIVNADGKFTYSVILPLNAKGKSGLKLTPNPAISNLTISGLKRSGVIKIYDVNGKTLITKNVQAVQALSIDVSLLRKGLYILKYFGSGNSLGDGADIQSQKFKKQ